ncbi:hypothetical protein RYX36_029290, partial [Vicia faba]
IMFNVDTVKRVMTSFRGLVTFAVIEEDIMIVGARIVGLSTSLRLHILGIKSLVLESTDSLRASGFALTTWKNAWKALNVIGVGDILCHQHIQLHGMAGLPSKGLQFDAKQYDIKMNEL